MSHDASSRACAACSAILAEGHRFCMQCGAPGIAEEAPAAVPAEEVAPPAPSDDAVPPMDPAPTVLVRLDAGPPPLQVPNTVRVSIREARALLDRAEADAEGGERPFAGEETVLPGASRKLIDPPTVPVRLPVPSNVFVPVVPRDPSVSSTPPPAWPAALDAQGEGRSAPAAAPTKESAAPPPAPSRISEDHHGDPLADDTLLFVAPPPEIGTVRSAASSARVGRDGLAQRLLRALALSALLGAMAWGVSTWFLRRYELAPSLGTELLRWIPAVLIAMLVTWRSMGVRWVVTYVGDRGLALCDVRFRFWPPRRPPIAVFRFDQARDLVVDIAHAPGRITFAYTWHGHDGAEMLRFSRRCPATPDGGRPRAPGKARLYDFCRAAERSWTLRTVERAREELSRPQSHFAFPVYTPNCSSLRVQEGAVIFTLVSGEAVIPAAEIVEVSVVDGVMRVATTEGELSLPCVHVGNVGALLLVMRHYLGLSVR